MTYIVKKLATVKRKMILTYELEAETKEDAMKIAKSEELPDYAICIDEEQIGSEEVKEKFLSLKKEK